VWIDPQLGNYKLEQMEPMFRQIDDRMQQMTGVRMVAPAMYWVPEAQAVDYDDPAYVSGETNSSMACRYPL
jgi:hypothetical protein